MDRLHVVDATLCTDCQRVTLPVEERLFLVEQLALSGQIDTVALGSLSSTPAEPSLIKKITQHVRRVVIAASTRSRMKDIEASWAAIREAERPELQVIIATSDWYRREILQVSRAVLLQHVKVTLAHARRLCPLVAFVAEDALRSEREYLCRLVEIAIEQGATSIVLPDTAGYALPDEYETLFRDLHSQVSRINQVVLGAHCHNQLGLAIANTISAIKGGARQITVDSYAQHHPSREDIERIVGLRPEVFGDIQSRNGC